MAIYQLSNDVISIAVNSHGAELKSLKRLDTGTEYMWCGDAKYWGRTSPVLFPFVGGVKDKEYRTKGKSYAMTQHGFARDMEFSLFRQESDGVWFELCSGEETRAKYPYDFVLKLGYRIAANRVEVLWQVENPGSEVLYFSIGGHPAFNCPIEPGTNQAEYFVDFGDIEEIVSTRISEKGLATHFRDVYPLSEGKLPLRPNLFQHDALVIEDSQTSTAALCRKDGSRYVTVTMDAPLFGIWSPPGKEAPFVCIEPWYGRCDGEDFEGTLEERKWGNQVSPGQAWKASYTIQAD